MTESVPKSNDLAAKRTNRWWLLGPLLILLPLAGARWFLAYCLSQLDSLDADQALLDFTFSPGIYLFMPLMVAALLFVGLAPGVLLILLCARRRRSWDELLVEGAALGMVLACLLSLLGGVGDRLDFRAWSYLAIIGVLGLLLLWRGGPREKPTGLKGLGFAVLLPILVLATLSTPKIFWESITGDGAHAFEATRLVIHQRSPFFGTEAGSMSGFPGANSVAAGYQASPIMAFLGADVAALRLTLFLNLGLLALVLRSFIPVARRHLVSLHLLMWLSLIAITSALAWSGGYDPYSADLALPAAQDLLYLALVLAAVSAWMKGQWWHYFGYGFLALTASPGGAFLLMTLPLARFLARGDQPLVASLKLGLAVAGVLILHLGFAYVAERFWGMESGEEHGLRALLRKLRWLDFGDWQRFLWLVPGGLFPILVFSRLTKVGVHARMLALIAVIAFFFFYLQLKTNLHYFAPAMVIPLAAFLASQESAPRRLYLAACFCLALVALYFSAPQTRGIVTVANRVGTAIDMSAIAGYEDCRSTAFQSLPVLSRAFHADHDPEVPTEAYGGSPLSWNYHARRPGLTAQKVLKLAPESVAVGPEMTEVHRDLGYVLLVSDQAQWQEMRGWQPKVHQGHAFLRTTRDRMFGSRALEHGPWVVDLKAVLGRWIGSD